MLDVLETIKDLCLPFLYSGMQEAALQFDLLFKDNSKHELSLENFIITRITTILE